MIRAGLFDSNLPNNLWCFRMEDSTEKFNAIRHSAHGQSPHFLWYKEKRHISEFRVWECAIEAKLPPTTTKAMDYRTESGYYLGTTGTKAVIRYWHPKRPDEIGYCTTARFYEHKTTLPNGELSTGSKLSQGIKEQREIIFRNADLKLPRPSNSHSPYN